MARKSRKREAPESHERWLITYADLITLLLIFFVIMYAMSKIDLAKYTVLAQSLNYQFKKTETMVPQGGGSGYIGVVDPTRGQPGEEPKNTDKQESADKKENTDKAEKDKKEKELQDLLQKINQYIQDNQLQTQVSASDTPRGIAVTLNDLFLFDLGKADLKSGAFPVLQRLGSLFPTLDNTQISIEGHTDNLPLNPGSAFKDNWRLSSERSLSVLRFFTDTEKLPSKKFLSVAHADTQPVAANDNDANRQKNRRVEIIVLRDPVKP